MPEPSAWTGSLLEGAKAVAGGAPIPVPPSPHGPLAAVTVTHSMPWPTLAMSNLILSPTEMLLTAVTFRMLEPARAAAARRPWVPGLRSEEDTSELRSRLHLVRAFLLVKKHR